MKIPPQKFVESLAQLELPDNPDGPLLNPYYSPLAVDIDNEMPARRRLYLGNHIACLPVLILVTDTLSYDGSRLTGVPLTSEWLVINNLVPRVPLKLDHLPTGGRLTNTQQPFTDRGATAIWEGLLHNNLTDRTLCWPVLPFQPYRADTFHDRTPSDRELELGMRWLNILLKFSAKAEVVTIGSRVRDLFLKHGIPSRCALAQPSQEDPTRIHDVFNEIAVAHNLMRPYRL